MWTDTCALSLQLLFGFMVALALNKIPRWKGLFRTLVLIPWAFPMIIVTFTWSYLLNDLYGIVNASLQTISKDLYEAAQIDGATPVQSFYYITLPFVRVVVGLLIILRTIWIFNSFDLIFLLTGGGPGTSTETVPIFAYRMGWTLYSLGRSSAVTILLLLFLTAGMCLWMIWFRIII